LSIEGLECHDLLCLPGVPQLLFRIQLEGLVSLPQYQSGEGGDDEETGDRRQGGRW